MIQRAAGSNARDKWTVILQPRGAKMMFSFIYLGLGPKLSLQMRAFLISVSPLISPLRNQSPLETKNYSEPFCHVTLLSD